jgi:hypothetical protein
MKIYTINKVLPFSHSLAKATLKKPRSAAIFNLNRMAPPCFLEDCFSKLRCAEKHIATSQRWCRCVLKLALSQQRKQNQEKVVSILDGTPLLFERLFSILWRIKYPSIKKVT